MFGTNQNDYHSLQKDSLQHDCYAANCMVLNPISVDNFASRFNWMAVNRALDWTTIPSSIWWHQLISLLLINRRSQTESAILSLSILVGFFNSCTLQKKRNPSIGKIYGWTFVYIKLGYWFCKTAVQKCETNCILEKHMNFAWYWFRVLPTNCKFYQAYSTHVYY